MAALRREPSLLNPSVSNRFVFATSKSLLVEILGSQSAALNAMKQDPSLLQEGDALEEMSAMQIQMRTSAKQLSAAALPALLAVGAAAAANELGYVPAELGVAEKLAELGVVFFLFEM